MEELKLPKTVKQIKNSKDYIDIDGTVYTYVSNYKGIETNKLIKKIQSKNFGYKYCNIYDNKLKKDKKKRVHRLIAEAFIPNPNNYPIVGHKNNIKDDNRIENLYWTTFQENTQKAVNDGLLVNKKGIEDSQSKPVIMYKTTTNEIIEIFGSICEASRITNIPKNTISRQAKYYRPTRKEYFFRYVDDEINNQNNIIGQFDLKTNKLLNTFLSFSDAMSKTNVSEKTICQQCKLKYIPKTKYPFYFKILNSKCEQTIESKKLVE